jgi:hypothetical protein
LPSVSSLRRHFRKMHQNPDCTKKMQGTRPCKETRPI